MLMDTRFGRVNHRHLEVQAGFCLFEPARQLKPFIKHYWYIDVPGEFSAYTKPDASMGLVFNLKQPELSYFQAKNTHPTLWHLTGNSRLLGVRFEIGGASALVGDLMQQESDYLLDVKSSGLAYQALKLAGANTPQACIQHLNAYFYRVLSLVPGDLPEMGELIRYFLPQHTQARVSEVASEIGMSQRQLNRYFQRYIGYSPKQVTGILRVNAARRQLNKDAPKVEMADLAYRLGYFDQAHFIHEFKHYAGLTPGEYWQKQGALA